MKILQRDGGAMDPGHVDLLVPEDVSADALIRLFRRRQEAIGVSNRRMVDRLRADGVATASDSTVSRTLNNQRRTSLKLVECRSLAVSLGIAGVDLATLHEIYQKAAADEELRRSEFSWEQCREVAKALRLRTTDDELQDLFYRYKKVAVVEEPAEPETPEPVRLSPWRVPVATAAIAMVAALLVLTAANVLSTAEVAVSRNNGIGEWLAVGLPVALIATVALTRRPPARRDLLPAAGLGLLVALIAALGRKGMATGPEESNWFTGLWPGVFAALTLPGALAVAAAVGRLRPGLVRRMGAAAGMFLAVSVLVSVAVFFMTFPGDLGGWWQSWYSGQAPLALLVAAVAALIVALRSRLPGQPWWPWLLDVPTGMLVAAGVSLCTTITLGGGDDPLDEFVRSLSLWRHEEMPATLLVGAALGATWSLAARLPESLPRRAILLVGASMLVSEVTGFAPVTADQLPALSVAVIAPGLAGLALAWAITRWRRA